MSKVYSIQLNPTIMTQFQTLNLPVLVDMLSDFTFHHAEMLTTSSDKKDIESCKRTIQLLQNEINYRNKRLLIAKAERND